MLAFPDWSADAENFKLADISSSPIHIQPEWYFLHFYAVLRSIPNKLGGLVAFAAALVALLLPALGSCKQCLKQIQEFTALAFIFLAANAILI